MLNAFVGDVVTANSVVDGPVSELAPGIFSVAVGEALGMLTLVTIGAVERGISIVDSGEGLRMLLVTVGPVGG